VIDDSDFQKNTEDEENIRIRNVGNPQFVKHITKATILPLETPREKSFVLEYPEIAEDEQEDFNEIRDREVLILLSKFLR